MNDPYSILGIARGADEESIKKAYRQKCKEYHPDLHPNDANCEEKFKEVQAAYSEVMREKNGGPQQSYQRSSSGYSSTGSYGSYSGSGNRNGQQYQDPFGFGFDPFGFGFGFGGNSNAGSRSSSQDSAEMQAANNYIRNGYYQEAMNVLNGIATEERNARWHYYCALANAGLGSNIRAQSEARAAVDMEPNNYEYQQLLSRLQNPGQSYTGYQQTYSQPGSMFRGNFCLQMWMYIIMCNIFSFCCCGGGRGGYYC